MTFKPMILLTLALALAPATHTLASEPAEAAGDTRAVLEHLVNAWPADPMFVPGSFGIRIGEGDDWHVTATLGADGETPVATLTQGFPETPAWYFEVDNEATLARLGSGDLAPGTAAVKAFSTDFAPLDVSFTEGFQPGEDFMGEMMQTLFHFWNASSPEITTFGAAHTRQSHGTNVAVLYYQPGLRSGWFSVNPGDHVNENPDSQTNPFPTLMVITRGSGIARLDGEDHVLSEGQSLYVPAGMRHEFLNHSDAPMEGILLMFGDGA